MTSALLLLPGAMLAGDVYTPPAPMPMPTYEETAWFFGLGVDYLIDAEEEFYNAHLGYDFGNGSSVFLESGWIGSEATAVAPFFGGVAPVSVDVDIVPVTLNYKYEWSFNDRFGAYVGVGAGASRIDLEASGPFGATVGDDSWSFTAQAFAGVVYDVTENFEIYGGGRYLYFDDTDLFGTEVEDFDDFTVGAGIRFNF